MVGWWVFVPWPAVTLFLVAAVAATAAPARTLLAGAAAFARRALLDAPPHGESGEGEHGQEDYHGRRVHAATSVVTDFAGRRNIAQRQKMSTRIATAVQSPNPPPQASVPS